MRADKYLAERFGSRTKSAEAIERQLVLVNGKPIKPKSEIKESDVITFLQTEELFVSNGGYKLDKAVKAFDFVCEDKIFVDIGASTGGFTDCLLQKGAKKVYAVDVGESLLHPSLKGNSKIVTMENTNARYLRKTDFLDEIDCVVADVSFISLKYMFPVIQEIVKEDGCAFVLIKPQFECENKNIGKSGIVHVSAHPKIVEKVLGYLEENALYPFGLVNAPIRKGKNIEYILWIKPNPYYALSKKQILESVENCIRLHRTNEEKE